MRETVITLVGVLLLAAAMPAAGKLTPDQVVERSLHAFYYPGQDMKARVRMELVQAGGGTRTRVLTMVRRDETEGGNQKYFMYFHEPGDVRRLSFLIWKYPDRDDDRWLYVPAVDLVRRIAASDRRSSFVGSDFTYEDVSGRDVGDDTHRLLGKEKVGEREAYRVESVPRAPVEYTRKQAWIDAENFLPLKEEYYDVQGEKYRRFTADQIESIHAGEATYPTVTKRTMANLKSGHRTVVTLESIAYDLGLSDSDFQERSLRRPPRDWIR